MVFPPWSFGARCLTLWTWQADAATCKFAQVALTAMKVPFSFGQTQHAMVCYREWRPSKNRSQSTWMRRCQGRCKILPNLVSERALHHFLLQVNIECCHRKLKMSLPAKLLPPDLYRVQRCEIFSGINGWQNVLYTKSWTWKPGGSLTD